MAVVENGELPPLFLCTRSYPIVFAEEGLLRAEAFLFPPDSTQDKPPQTDDLITVLVPKIQDNESFLIDYSITSLIDQ
jgi:hypothetical protein